MGENMAGSAGKTPGSRTMGGVLAQSGWFKPMFADESSPFPVSVCFNIYHSGFQSSKNSHAQSQVHSPLWMIPVSTRGPEVN